MEQLDLLVLEVDNVINNQFTQNTQEALKFMDDKLHENILPIIKNHFFDEATKYVAERDLLNVNLFILANNILQFVKTLFCEMECVEVHIMSSLNAKLNLIGESDIDIGILVEGLNNIDQSLNIDLFEKIKFIIESKTQFVFESVFNESDPTNSYYSFGWVVNDVEIELKVRNKLTTQTMLKLHNYLDNVLDDESKILITYAKFLLKKHQKDHSSHSYKKLKQIIYEAGFSHVKGGFLMPYTLNL